MHSSENHIHHKHIHLEAKRDQEAIYLLFGEKYDSLPSLIRKVVEEEKSDRTNRYVTLLCAEQVLTRIEESHPEFKTKHKAEFRKVRGLLRAKEEIRSGFDFGTENERSKFFDWFERHFLKDMSDLALDEQSR